jgi:hypothetical protein
MTGQERAVHAGNCNHDYRSDWTLQDILTGTIKQDHLDSSVPELDLNEVGADGVQRAPTDLGSSSD